MPSCNIQTGTALVVIEVHFASARWPVLPPRFPIHGGQPWGADEATRLSARPAVLLLAALRSAPDRSALDRWHRAWHRASACHPARPRPESPGRL